ncbi:MAG: T9SS-dependent M36 family metallopeptidase [Bacteroidota bacterium]
MLKLNTHFRASLMLVFSFFISSLLFGQAQGPLDAALRHLEENKDKLGLNDVDLSNYVVTDQYVTSFSGVTHVILKQTHNGIEVFNGQINVNVLPDGTILNVGSKFISNLASRVNTDAPAISAFDALGVLLRAKDIPFEEAPPRLKEQVNEHFFIFEENGIALEPVKVNLIYQPMADRSVKLAWNVRLYELDADDWWNVSVDATTGDILRTDNQVIHCSFGSSDAVCQEDKHFHREASFQRRANSTLKTKKLNAPDSYNVYAWPIESPNHGSRSLEIDPADPVGSPFGWHDTDGAPGPEFTITRGNNTHAYQDIFDNNFSAGDEPDGGLSLDFDFPLDASLNTPYVYIEAAVTNLFYWCNVVHDVWYIYGFDEAAGNFQANNYGNPGVEGDWIRAEAMDGSGQNNANFSSGADGSNARIQMYIWGSAPPGGGNQFVVTEPPSVAGGYGAVPAGFGANLPITPIVADVVEIDDGTGTTTDACEAIVNGAALTGNIALIDRGDCQFGVKCLAAENAGAIAVIMCNNNPGEGAIVMGAGTDGGAVTIPAVMLSFEDCQTIRAEIPGLEVQLSAGDNTIPNPGPTARDGDLDNGIIAHEYGHGISIRGTGGPSTGSCLFNNEQQGEGWSDYFGLVMTIEPGDQGSDVRGIGTYAVNQPTTGGGIRTFPYSTDFGVNPHTYADIANESIPHGVGSVWCAMIWDMTWALIDEYGFDQDIYYGTGGNNIAMRLVMDGIKLQSCGPGFVDARDGILAADVANFGGANQCLIWEVFARRGLGYSASQGSADNVGDGTEAFDLPPICLDNVFLVKTAPETVEAGEIITYTFEITNPSLNDYSGVVVTDEIPAGTTFVPGSISCGGSVSGTTITIPLGNLNAGETTTCTFQVIAPDQGSTTLFFDDVENEPGQWVTNANVGTENWVQSTANPFGGNQSWFANNTDSESDFTLEMANSFTVPSGLIAFSFAHSYDTEASWDGGVVEIQANGGNWQDLNNFFVQNGYNATINENPASTISQQPAFTGNSNGYITSIIYLNAFIGQDVKIRFRFASDGFVDGDGWHIDDIRVTDLINVPNEACVSANEVEGGCDDIGQIGTIVLGDATTSIGNVENTLDISLYPNPTDSKVYIEISDAINGKVEIEVMSVDGRAMSSQTIESVSGPIEVDMSTLGAGIYLVQVKTDDAVALEKIVVQ